MRYYLLAPIVEQPLSVESPVIEPVGILLHSDQGCRARLAIGAVVDSHRSALGKGDGVAYRLAILDHRSYSRHIIITLQSLDNLLQRIYIGIHLAAQLFQSCQPRAHIGILVPHGYLVILRTGD